MIGLLTLNSGGMEREKSLPRYNPAINPVSDPDFPFGDNRYSRSTGATLPRTILIRARDFFHIFQSGTTRWCSGVGLTKALVRARIENTRNKTFHMLLQSSHHLPRGVYFPRAFFLQHMNYHSGDSLLIIPAVSGICAVKSHLWSCNYNIVTSFFHDPPPYARARINRATLQEEPSLMPEFKNTG
jgi:hypothetical protein